VREGYQWDYVFDWTILKHQQTSRLPTAPRPEGEEAPLPEAAEAPAADSTRRRLLGMGSGLPTAGAKA
jgi:hypothetical protein